MAPWPDQDNELKAPDRNKTDDEQSLEILKSKSEPPEDKKFITANFEEDGQSETKKKDVHSLDDGQLKALLDEAIQYKNPKDREGKSKIFRELLQKVEDEIDCSSPIVGYRRKVGRNSHTAKEGNRNTVSERVSRGGSLQNIFHAASTAEFETHHTSGARKKNKRQSPGSSVSSRQREGGSLPSNVNAGWPLESWQSDQIRKKGLFDRDSQQQNHISTGLGNTASGFSSSVASSTPQARRQTVMHSPSNELTSRKQNSGELYPLRRHHSNSDQSKSAEVASSKLKQQSDNSSMVRKMPQISKPPDYFYVDMDFSLEMKPCAESEPAPCLDKKVSRNFNKKFRITPCGVDSENTATTTATNNNNNHNHSNSNNNINNNNNNNGNNNNNNTSEVFTSKASFEVEPVDTALDLDFVSERKVNIDLELKGCAKLSEGGNQGRINDQGGLRSQKYRNSISLVHISPKSNNESSRTDENGNALNSSSLSTQGGSTLKKGKCHKRKQLAEKNVVLSQNIAGYRGHDELKDILNFIESDNNKSKQLKKNLTKGKKHEKKRQNIQKCSSLEEISQRNIEDLTENSDNQRNGRKQKVVNNEESGSRERRSLGEQVYARSESQNELASEQVDENNSDSEFQMVTKKQRKRKMNDQNQKRVRNHRSSKRSPRRKSTSSVPPSERSGDSDVDSIHSVPVGGGGGGAPITSYADIAAGNPNFFDSKGIQEADSLNTEESNQGESESAKNNEIKEWCESVSQHMEKNKNSNNISNNNNNNNNKNNINNNHINNESNYIYNINNINNNTNNNISYLKNFTRQDDKKHQNLVVDQNGICDNNVKKLKDLVIVDNSVVDSEVAKNNKVVEPPSKNDIKVASNCDLNQCKNVDNKNIGVKKNWSKKDFSREDFPSLPVKSEHLNFHKIKESGEANALAVSDGHKFDWNTSKTLKKMKGEGEIKHRRANRSKSVGPNARPAVILLHDERSKESEMCEITFGFEVNEQLLTAEDSNRLLDEESNRIIPSVSKNRGKIGSLTAAKVCENAINEVNCANSNGNMIYNDVIENTRTNASKGDYEEITNSTVQALFKRHEIAARYATPRTNACAAVSATSIANKYVPPIAPIDFNHEKIVTFVGMAWEDVMRNGKIQYYSGEK